MITRNHPDLTHVVFETRVFRFSREQEFRAGPEPPGVYSYSVARPPRCCRSQLAATAPAPCCVMPPSPAAPTHFSPGKYPLSWSHPARNAAGSRSPNGPAIGPTTAGGQLGPDSSWLWRKPAPSGLFPFGSPSVPRSTLTAGGATPDSR